MRRLRWLFAPLLLIFVSCARAPLSGSEDRSKSLRPIAPPSELTSDDLPLATLVEALQLQIAFLAAHPQAGGPWVFGNRVTTREEYLAGLKRLAELAAGPGEAFISAVRNEFDFFEVYGQKSWGDVFMTSYYEPVIQGSRKRTARFNQAIYRAPPDLLTLDLAPFDAKYKDDRKLRARLSPDSPALLPYYTREEIDSKGALSGRKLELCWVEPWDAFSLQVQGSATIHFEDGKSLSLVYAEKNGQRYESIGKFVKDAIAPQEVTMESIELYLKSKPGAEFQRVLNLNPSYIFFKPSPAGSAITTLGVPASDGRTIATDARFFPRGAIGYLVSDGIHRFVLDQDTGGAIQGPGRLDLFWGRGDGAKPYAGKTKQRGKLFYLAPKVAH